MSYIIFNDDSGATCAKNETTGRINDRSTNASSVIQYAIDHTAVSGSHEYGIGGGVIAFNSVGNQSVVVNHRLGVQPSVILLTGTSNDTMHLAAYSINATSFIIYSQTTISDWREVFWYAEARDFR